jgi:CRP/FNR family transcriptional regulator, cyclic AMP receptor protein
MAHPSVSELERIPLLAVLSRDELQSAASFFTVRSYPKDAILITEGDRVDVFNFVLAGRVKAFWRDEDGRQLDLTVIKPGDHFPDATLGGEPAHLSAITLEDLRVAAISMADLERLLLRHPQLAVMLMKRLLLTVTRSYSMEDVYGRVTQMLLTLATERDGQQVTEPLTHAEIGRRVGATREMVGRVMRDLSRGGYIRVERTGIAILRKPPRHW